jgi:hypothetical protein
MIIMRNIMIKMVVLKKIIIFLIIRIIFEIIREKLSLGIILVLIAEIFIWMLI